MRLSSPLGLFFFIPLPLVSGHGSSAENLEDADKIGYTNNYNALYNSRKHMHQHGDNSAKSGPGSSAENLEDADKVGYTNNYNALYNSRKHKHPPADKSAKGTSNPYKASYAYSNEKQLKENEDDNKHAKNPSITSYGDHANSRKPYITQYGDGNEHSNPYLTAYGLDEKESDKDKHAKNSYLTGYRGDVKENDKNKHVYLTSYGDHVKENSRKPYITQYGDKKKHFKSSYLTGYRQDEKENNENKHEYLTAYGDAVKDDSRKPYITQYGDGDKHSANSYLTGYRENGKEIDKNEQVKSSYVTAYGDAVNDDSRKPCITQYGDGDKHSANSYLTGYRGNGKETDNNKQVKSFYLTAYGDAVKDDSRKPHSANSYLTGYRENGKEIDNNKQVKSPYLTAYGDAVKDDSRKPYITQYGHGDKHSANSYLTGYRENGNEADKNKQVKSSYLTAYGDKANHAEAFKDGFFTLDDLYVGKIMGLMFPVEDFSDFLPRKVAESIPFSISQLPSVLQLFSLSPDSPQAHGMQDVHEQCDMEPLTGETKVCVTSLESMIEFVQSILGSSSNYELLTTSYPTMSSTSSLQNFTIAEISKELGTAPEWVACHPFSYPYAVYYCHYISTGTKIFKVSLAGDNGERMEALGVCHLDTSEWSAGHVVFKQLGIKPGEAPICHFFPVKHLMWIPAAPTKASS